MSDQREASTRRLCFPSTAKWWVELRRLLSTVLHTEKLAPEGAAVRACDTGGLLEPIRLPSVRIPARSTEGTNRESGVVGGRSVRELCP